MEKHLQNLRNLSKLLDTEFGVGRFRFGLDPIIGLLPGIGDLLALGIGLYIIFVASQLNIPKETLTKMIVNTFIDWGIGTIPIAGDVFDFVWRSNKKNLQLLEQEIQKLPHKTA
jgi:hypothetical protein